VVRIPVDEHEADSLTVALELFATQPDVRMAMAQAALRLVEREHDVGRVADRYAAAVEQAAGGPAVQADVLAEVARAAADVGIDADSADAAAIARRLAEVELVE
jgi:hypothetical protein